MKRFWLRIGLVVFLLGASVAARADDRQEFLMSCTYGVLAGTLVGAASLAFTDRPGDNLRNIARGASLGLYAGILLGAYVVYVVPGQIERQKQREQEQLMAPPEEESLPPESQWQWNWDFYPVMAGSRLAGGGAKLSWSF